MNQEPVIPTDGMTISQDTVLAPGTYFLPRGLTIAADGVTLDGNGALIVGAGREGSGVTMAGRAGVSLQNLKLAEFRHGIVARDCRDLHIVGNRVSGTQEVEADTIFLDIWLPPERAYGAGMLLERVTDSLVQGNDLQHQQNGLLSYHCARLTVRRNKAHYSSGFGFHLYATSDSLYEENGADYCCRFNPREGGLHFGHVGGDAAGFLIVMGSSRNTFRRNSARLGGDGFFVAGLTPQLVKAGCDDNLFEENDASLSPNISFEATFCRGNVFRNNRADRSNFGFWLGYSWDTIIEGNRMVMNRQAGIACEHGHANLVRGNTFQANGHGLLLWTQGHERFASVFPEHLTTYGWTVEDNTFTRNVKGIRVAADQDHGIRKLAEPGGEATRPRDITIRKNDIQDNRVGIELVKVDRVLAQENILNRNVEANLRQDDTREVTARNNLGAAGAYL